MRGGQDGETVEIVCRCGDHGDGGSATTYDGYRNNCVGATKGLPLDVRQDPGKHAARCNIEKYCARSLYSICKIWACVPDANWCWCTNKGQAKLVVRKLISQSTMASYPLRHKSRIAEPRIFAQAGKVFCGIEFAS